jgi:hypothetical protein
LTHFGNVEDFSVADLVSLGLLPGNKFMTFLYKGLNGTEDNCR